jgi:hypothetical protein
MSSIFKKISPKTSGPHCVPLFQILRLRKKDRSSMHILMQSVLRGEEITVFES